MEEWIVQIWYKGEGFVLPHQRDADDTIISKTQPVVTENLIKIPGEPIDGDMFLETEDLYYGVSALAHFSIKKTVG